MQRLNMIMIPNQKKMNGLNFFKIYSNILIKNATFSEN
jgi:hypothetical protein